MANRFIEYRTLPVLIEWAAFTFGIASFSDDARTISQMIRHDNGSVEPLAVVVCDRWTEHSCNVSIVSDGTTRWASRGFFQAVYEYVFTHAKRLRMNMLVSVHNTKSINTQVKLGHVVEGRMRDAFGEGHDGILYGFTKQDYLASKWHKKPDQLEKGNG